MKQSLSRRWHRRAFKTIAATAMIAVVAAPSPVAARAPQGMSRGELSRALAAMSPEERSGRSALFTDPNAVVLAYATTTVSFDKKTGKVVNEQAGSTFAPLSVATGITNLRMSLSISYDREAPCCRWNVSGFFDWTAAPPNGFAGDDQFAIAWANGLALRSSNAWGTYMGHSGGVRNPISMNESDVSPNVGDNWEFAENWPGWDDTYADYGWLTATISHSAPLKGKETNLVLKYFHTWNSLQYAVGFGSSGPSITLSPTTSSKGTALSVLFKN